MADNTPVNGMITDAVTQANVKVLGDAPAMAMGSLYQSLAHSHGILYENQPGRHSGLFGRYHGRCRCHLQTRKQRCARQHAFFVVGS